ncbi:MAG: methylmalonyl Co-A mutase-associated GTPase MeaB [Chloroflexota bacterium]|nr:methylmalonyl Co-A mutase-associated GTPase MeaB [Chloroflexota bacterium]
MERLRSGDARALPRLISQVERGSDAGQRALTELYPLTGRAHVVGITGPPGAGKSTLINALLGSIRGAGRRVAVIAVDPSSPVSGGAVLGDRIRMTEHHADDGVFIRGMAARGRGGGLAAATAGVAHVLDAAGFDVILIETVGAGQDGVEIATLARTVVVLQVPGLGDGVQAIKAGMLEIGDILVVSKADRPGARDLGRTLRQAVMPLAADVSRQIPVLYTIAATGEGVDKLWVEIERHRRYLIDSGRWDEKTLIAARNEVLASLRTEIERRLLASPNDVPAIAAAIEAVASRRQTAGSAARALIETMLQGRG